jgi:glucan-binding YG repeat protein
MKKAIAHLLVVLTCISCLSVGGYAAEPELLADDGLTTEDALLTEDQALAEDAAAQLLSAQDEQEPAAADEDTADTQEADASLQDAGDAAEAAEEEAAAQDEQDVQDTEDIQDAQDAEDAPEAETADEDAVLSGEGSAEAEAQLAAAAVTIDFSGMSNGWNLVNGKWYYVVSGAAATGWKKVGTAWYYLDPTTGGAMAVGLTTIENDGTYFLSTTSGAMKTGWVYDNTDWYYFASSGRQKTGWAKLNGYWYYLDPTEEGAMAVGLTTIENDGTYFLSTTSGAMKTGWIYNSSNWYYFASSGRQKTGWAKLNGYWYYLDPTEDGAMATGLTTIDGDGTYFLSTTSGAMKTGWLSSGGKWYYFDASGRQVTGWMKTGAVWTKKWYYLDPENNGAMVTGWLQSDGNSYYMSPSSGAMQTGWLSYNNNWYYLGVTGKMLTGWVYYNGYDYYLYTQDDDVSASKVGTMASSTVVDDRTIDSKGRASLPTYAAGSTAADIIKARAQYYTSDTDNLLLLDRSSSKLYVFEGSTNNWTLTHTWSVAAGAASTYTPSGTYEVQAKGYYFDSGSARCFWWTQFYGSYCFHSTLYYQDGTSPSTASVMNSSLGSNISHGCVRLATNNAYWVYSNVDAGTGVIVY